MHEGGIRVEWLDDGAWRFTNARGGSIDACSPGRTQPLGDWSRLVAANRAQGIAIDAKTAATRWRGERMDYGIAIDSLVFRARSAAKGHPVVRVGGLGPSRERLQILLPPRLLASEPLDSPG